MTANLVRRALISATIVSAGMAAVSSATAQSVSLNYENLSSMEEPLAVEAGDVTVTLTGLVDARLSADHEDGNDTDTGTIANFQVSARTQLPNRWQVDLSYFGQHASDPTTAFGGGDGYTDNAALSVGSYWGTVSGGNVSGVVREMTRRLRGAGNAALVFDDFLGSREDLGGGYTGRFGPWVMGLAVDEDGGLDLGASFQRPAGARDWRLALRAAEGTFDSSGGQRFDTKGLGLVGEVIYGSTTLDAGAGYERLSSSGPDLDRRYASVGMRTKAGVLSLSLEGHVGRIEGKDEASVALGGQYDIARGLSANLGLNHAKAQVSFEGVPLLDIEETKTVLSLRYSF